TKPYTPVLNSVYLGYAAYSAPVSLIDDDEDDFEDREVQFYHIGAFGEAEQQAYLSNTDDTTATSFDLIPHFAEYATVTEDVTNFSADWYIGIKNLEANQSVNILFQFLEGSTNPLVSKPDDHVYLSYMANNQWIEFEDVD